MKRLIITGTTRALCDERVHQAILQREIELIGFRDVPAFATCTSVSEAAT